MSETPNAPEGIKHIFKRLITRYFTRQALPYWFILLLDCVTIIVSELAVVYALNGPAQFFPFQRLITTLGFYLIPYLVCFKIFYTYSGISHKQKFMII